MLMLREFKTWLSKSGLAENTIGSYLWTARHFIDEYGGFTVDNLLKYKGYLVEHYKPQTVNLRLQAINKYLKFIGLDSHRLKLVKVQQKNFLENVISDADYKFLKSRLKQDGMKEWYFIVWFMGATGARVSELLKVKVEDIKTGYFDIYSKGGKVRRLYIPKSLRAELSAWLVKQNRYSGFIFLNRFGKVISSRGISMQLKSFANRYGIDPHVVHPHSFRHRFAKNFLDKYNDIAFLADLMGHESIQTTRIYLRHTAVEQMHIVDKVVTW